MTQSANRNSILGWVKNLKRNALLNESINEIDNSEDISTLALRSPPPNPSFMATILPQPIAFPSLLPRDTAGWSGTPDLLRPLLSHKSRSTQNVGRERSSSNTGTSPLPESSFHEIRQHRDSFLQNNLLIDKNSQYFGVPLSQAVEQAAAKISILGSSSASTEDESVLHYGRIPIVVAKCGVYLKTSGLNVEGIFRVAGSSKRIKELQIVFNTPPTFGKKLNWDGFTVHDAASVLRRYLNALPEPLIVLDLYEDFRDILRSKPRIIKYLKYRAENPKEPRSENTKVAQQPEQQDESKEQEQSKDQEQPKEVALLQNDSSNLPEPDLSSPGSISPAKQPHKEINSLLHTQMEGDKLKSYKKLTRDMYAAIGEYKELLDQLPCLSKQLLFYILDLLAMVQNYSLENLMSARNLAAIFQPSILLHPNHDMDPEEYALSQSVVEFLIQYAYKILPSSDSAATKAKANLGKPSQDPTPQLDVSEEPSNVVNRQYSKSFSTNAQDFDMIGYKTANQQLDIPGATFPDPTSDEDAIYERAKPLTNENKSEL